MSYWISGMCQERRTPEMRLHGFRPKWHGLELWPHSVPYAACNMLRLIGWPEDFSSTKPIQGMVEDLLPTFTSALERLIQMSDRAMKIPNRRHFEIAYGLTSQVIFNLNMAKANGIGYIEITFS